MLVQKGQEDRDENIQWEEVIAKSFHYALHTVGGLPFPIIMLICTVYYNIRSDFPACKWEDDDSPTIRLHEGFLSYSILSIADLAPSNPR